MKIGKVYLPDGVVLDTKFNILDAARNRINLVKAMYLQMKTMKIIK